MRSFTQILIQYDELFCQEKLLRYKGLFAINQGWCILKRGPTGLSVTPTSLKYLWWFLFVGGYKNGEDLVISHKKLLHALIGS